MINVQQLLASVRIPASILVRSAEYGKFLDSENQERFWTRLNVIDSVVAKKAGEAGLDIENLSTFLVKVRNAEQSFDFKLLEDKVIKVPEGASIVPIVKNGRLEELALSIDFADLEGIQ